MITLWISTWSTNIRTDCTSPVTRVMIEPGRVGVEEPETQPLELVVDLPAQVHDQVPLDEDVDPYGVDVVEDRPAGREGEDEPAKDAEDVHGVPVGGQAEVQEADHCLRAGLGRVVGDDLADIVDADAREAQAEQAHGQQNQLDPKNLHAPEAVPPRQPEQAADQLRIGGPGLGAHRRRSHLDLTL